jgi:glycine cleavage system P protein (glycine dehydrogenase)
MVMSLTSMHIANASLLDEATAAAEGMVMSIIATNCKRRTFFVDSAVAPQTIAVLRTRCKGFGVNLRVGDASSLTKEDMQKSDISGVLVQYPDVDGSVRDFSELSHSVHSAGALLVVATDLLALALLKPPGEWGADIVLGSSARFGVPVGYGGPHAAFFATTEKLKRKMPGRLIGRSKDVTGNPAYRLALQSQFRHRLGRPPSKC